MYNMKENYRLNNKRTKITSMLQLKLLREYALFVSDIAATHSITLASG